MMRLTEPLKPAMDAKTTSLVDKSLNSSGGQVSEQQHSIHAVQTISLWSDGSLQNSSISMPEYIVYAVVLQSLVNSVLVCQKCILLPMTREKSVY